MNLQCNTFQKKNIEQNLEDQISPLSCVHEIVANFTGMSLDFPDGPVVKNLPANAGDTGSIPGPGRFHMLHGS